MCDSTDIEKKEPVQKKWHEKLSDWYAYHYEEICVVAFAAYCGVMGYIVGDVRGSVRTYNDIVDEVAKAADERREEERRMILTIVDIVSKNR